MLIARLSSLSLFYLLLVFNIRYGTGITIFVCIILFLYTIDAV